MRVSCKIKMVAIVCGIVLGGAISSFAANTEMASLQNNGAQFWASSSGPSTSADGRFVAFRTWTGWKYDVFVRDLEAGTTEWVSVNYGGGASDGRSETPAISADGRYVVFRSEASNLVEGDTNGVEDVFVRDRQTGVTELVSVASDGTQGNGRSQNSYGSISDDGRFVAFTSYSDNLVPNDTNGQYDTFVRDRTVGITTRVSISSTGTEGNGGSYQGIMSGNGQVVAFSSEASNLVPSDTNAKSDAFVHDLATGFTSRVSTASNGIEGNDYSGVTDVDYEGRYLTIDSYSSNFVANDINGNNSDVFVHDRTTNETKIVSIATDGTQGNNVSGSSSISADGKLVSFNSLANNLVAGDTNGITDTFLHDLTNGTTERVSIGYNGQEGNSSSQSNTSISANGRFVVFGSSADNLIPLDTNVSMDVFVRDRADDVDGDGFVVYGNIQVEDCNDNDATIHPGALETKHDGVDQDCNGYDLTIDIPVASYRANQNKLTVEATSTFKVNPGDPLEIPGSNASLQVAGYGPMIWKSSQQKWTFSQTVAGNPGTVTVSGTEGAETATVVVQ